MLYSLLASKTRVKMLSDCILQPYRLVFVQILVKSFAMVIDSGIFCILFSHMLVNPISFSREVISLSFDRIEPSQFYTLVSDRQLGSFKS